MKAPRATVIVFLAVIFSALVASASPPITLTGDDAIKITITACNEAITCTKYPITIKLKALKDVTIKKLEVEIYCNYCT
ncbi:MAG: hypothetical protein DRJ46_01665, partial [Thermoprotei archaeon]